MYVPIEDQKAPSFHQADFVVKIIQDIAQVNGRLLLHCAGGLGRAGTILACYLSLYDTKMPDACFHSKQPIISATAAIHTIRSIRPGSIESDEQAQFVHAWVSHRWKMSNKIIIEPDAKEWTWQGDIEKINDNRACLILIGLPGSGKSWFSNALKKREPDTIVISQDDLQSSSSCQNMLKSNKKTHSRVVIDRCNVSLEQRVAWFQTDRPKIGIVFHFDAELCLQRILFRLDHPTLPPERAGSALNEFAEHWTEPSLNENFDCIIDIHSINNVKRLLDFCTGNNRVPPHKFPRTKHAMNLGSAASDDLVLDHRQLQDIFSKSHRVVVEEKIDGANLGIHLSGFDFRFLVHNRGHFINSQSQTQFKKLDTWLSEHAAELISLLNRDDQWPSRFVLYGEWMAMTHSIPYTAVPDLFIAFDMYDRLESKFLSRKSLHNILSKTTIHQVPSIDYQFDLKSDELINIVRSPSKYYDGPVEGVYIRFEDQTGNTTDDRAKIVRADFLTSDKHWKAGKPTSNIVKIQEL